MRTLNGTTSVTAWAPRTEWASIAGFWLLYFVVSTVRAFVAAHPHQLEMLCRRAVVIALMIAVTWIVRLVLERAATSLARSIAAAVMIALPAALLYAGLSAIVFAMPGPGMAFTGVWRCPHTLTTTVGRAGNGWMALSHTVCDDSGSMSSQLITATADGYFLFIAWSALYLALQYAGEVRNLERRAAELRSAAQSAELRALRYQVNPHFLFNTLNSLSSLVVTGRTDRAERMIANLSTFFRTSLSGDPTHDVTLVEEVALQRLYLDIEAVRFPERLIADLNIPPELEEVGVPGLILQPLVENAVKHGVSMTSRPVTIKVRAVVVGGMLRLTVEDDGAPSAESPSAGAPRVGLCNVCDRLAARYGDAAQCRWERLKPEGFRVEVNLPMHPNAN